MTVWREGKDGDCGKNMVTVCREKRVKLQRKITKDDRYERSDLPYDVIRLCDKEELVTVAVQKTQSLTPHKLI